MHLAGHEHNDASTKPTGPEGLLCGTTAAQKLDTVEKSTPKQAERGSAQAMFTGERSVATCSSSTEEKRWLQSHVLQYQVLEIAAE